MSSNPSEYEKLRSDNLKRNEAFLKSIGIQDNKKRLRQLSEVESNKKKCHSKINISKDLAKTDDEFVPRRSTRSRRTVSSNIDDELNMKLATSSPIVDKKIKPLENMLIMNDEDDVSLSQFLVSLERGHTESKLTGNRLCDDEYDAQLRELFNSPGGHRGKEVTTYNNHKEEKSDEFLTHKDRSQEDINKVTKTRITELIFHPTTHNIAVIGGDHTGHIGLWNTNGHGTPFFLTRPHTSGISGIHIFPDQYSSIWTTSLDKYIRKSDVEKEQFIDIYKSDTSIRCVRRKPSSVGQAVGLTVYLVVNTCRCTTFVNSNMIIAAGDKGYVHAGLIIRCIKLTSFVPLIIIVTT